MSTIDEAIQRIHKFDELPDKAVEFMRIEVYNCGAQKRTGMLANSIVKEQLTDTLWQVGPSGKGNGTALGPEEYGYYVAYGRGEVKPKNKKFLHFVAKSGDEVFTRHSNPWEPDRNFLEATIADLEAYKRTI